MTPIKSLVLVLLPILLIGCNSAPVRIYESEQQIQHRNEDEERVWFAGEQLDDSIRKKRIVYRSESITGYAQSLLDKLYPEFNGSLRVQLLDSPKLNAFALPNGSIYLNIGLVGRMENEAQLATVLAHEASHFTHQHSLQQRNSADGAVLVGVGFELLTGIPFTGTLLTQGILSGYSQSHENEADREGFKRLIANGYDPAEASATFRILQEEVEALEIDEPFMFSSHPKLSQRVDNFKQLTAESGRKGGLKNEAQFLSVTRELRAAILDRYLKMHSYKTLLLILENDQLRKHYPDYSRYYLGEAYRLRGDEGDEDKALVAFQQTLEEAPGFGLTHKGIGLIKYKRGELQMAKTHFMRYLEYTPGAGDSGYIKAYIGKITD